MNEFMMNDKGENVLQLSDMMVCLCPNTSSTFANVPWFDAERVNLLRGLFAGFIARPKTASNNNPDAQETPATCVCVCVWDVILWKLPNRADKLRSGIIK